MRRPDLWGWVLFLACAVLFVAAGIRDGDVLLITGSSLFLVACGLFLLPYARR